MHRVQAVKTGGRFSQEIGRLRFLRREVRWYTFDMVRLVEQHRAELADLCEKYGVKRLELFGSAARWDFDGRRSDLDFLVEFVDQGWEGSAKRYFGLLFGLEDLLHRRIDLVDRVAVTKGFLAVAEQHRDMLYAA